MPQLKKSQLISIVLLLIGTALLIRSWLFGSTTDVIGEMFLGVLNLILFFSFWGMVWQLFRVLLNWHWYRTEDGKRFQYDVLLPTPELPKKFVQWQDEILDLAFKPLGTFKISWKSGKESSRVSVYTDPTKTIGAQIVSTPPLYEYVAFETRFEDGFSLEISYHFSLNVNVDQPSIFTANLISSITEAYQYHLHHYDRFQAEHGAPQVRETIEDFFPKPETHKAHMQDTHTNRLQDHLKYAGMFATFVLSSLVGLIVSFMSGAWVGVAVAAIGIGMFMLVLDYGAIAARFRPVDEDKARKEKAKSDIQMSQ
jgi:hypothetical protein